MSNQAYNYVLAHSIGHVLGLPDLVGPSVAGPPAPGNSAGNNLMCSGDSINCPTVSQEGTFLNPTQVSTAIRGIRQWQSN